MSFDSLPYLENVRIQPLFGKEEKDINALRQRLDDMSRLSSEFVVLLSTSTMIATFGLFQNSAAVIIGAMIIAPLMRPLMGLAYGSLIAIRRAGKLDNRSVRAFVLFNLHDRCPKPSNSVIRCSTASESRRTNPFILKN